MFDIRDHGIGIFDKTGDLIEQNINMSSFLDSFQFKPYSTIEIQTTVGYNLYNLNGTNQSLVVTKFNSSGTRLSQNIIPLGATYQYITVLPSKKILIRSYDNSNTVKPLLFNQDGTLLATLNVLASTVQQSLFDYDGKFYYYTPNGIIIKNSSGTVLNTITANMMATPYIQMYKINKNTWHIINNSNYHYILEYKNAVYSIYNRTISTSTFFESMVGILATRLSIGG